MSLSTPTLKSGPGVGGFTIRIRDRIGRTHGVRGILEMLALACVCLLAGWAGLRFSVHHHLVSPVWPAAGVGLVALLRLGVSRWPGLFLGAWLVAQLGDMPQLASLGMATGSTLETVLGVLLLRRVGFTVKLERLQDVVALTVGVALGCTLINALVGTTSLALAGQVPWEQFARTAWVWWGGNVLGVIVVVPVLLMLGQLQLLERRVEAVALAAATLVVCMEVFLGGWVGPGAPYVETLFFFPLAVWAALRFGTHGTAFTSLLIAALSIWGTVRGLGPFAQEPRERALLFVQLIIAINAVTGLLLAAVIAERRNAVKRLELLAAASEELRARTVAAERVATVGMLAAGVGHELNNPLAYLGLSLAGISRGLGQGAAGLPEALKCLRGAQEGAERLRLIVQDLRMLSRDGAEDRKPVRLAEVVAPALRMTRHLLLSRARWVEHYEPVPRVLGSEARLVQVLVNLLVNAAQSIPEGAPERHEVRVRIDTAPDGRARVEVADTGGGIAPDLLPHLFEPFFTTRAQQEGTGLGLSICQQIIQAHGGEIHVQSTHGRGSVFTVLLPPASEREAPVAPEHASAERADALSAAARRGRILIVDDEPRLVQSMRLLLEPSHEVITTTRGSEALAMVSAGQRFDVVVCDLQMPGTTGMDIYARLREQVPELAERLVFISGGAYTQAARDFIRTVRNQVLEKPVRPEVLLATIDAAMPRESTRP